MSQVEFWGLYKESQLTGGTLKENLKKEVIKIKRKTYQKKKVKRTFSFAPPGCQTHCARK